MGANLGKELGLYNEEEIILPIVSGNDTPTGPRYRILRSDPRSATLGIIRTPIQVECTPAVKKSVSVLTLEFDTKMSDTSQSEDIEDETDKEIVMVKSSKKEETVRKYLETDIDAIDSSKYSPETDMPLPPLKHPRIITLSTDPRSPPSSEVFRSPIQVECSPGMFSLCSRIDSASFDISDCVSNDPSVIVSEIGESPLSTVHKKPEDFKNWFEDLEKKMTQLSSTDSSFASSPKQSPFKFADRNLMKKKLFLTPENNKIPLNLKPRTPLGNVHNNQVSASPKNLLRAKQWRGIEEERARRGVQLDDENTPPPLPPLSHVSSAPGKLIRKRNIADWDSDSTIFI